MKRFLVTVIREVVERSCVVIDAPDAARATAEAKRRLIEDGLDEWEYICEPNEYIEEVTPLS